MHYCRWRKYGDPKADIPHLKDRVKVVAKCSIQSCGKDAATASLCNAHYLRLRRHGDPLKMMQRSPGEASKFLCENVMTYEGDDCLFWPFNRATNGHARVRWDGKLLQAARVVCTLAYGDAPSDSHEAAHSCGKGNFGCIAKSHLRWATPKQNNADKKDHGTYLEGERSPNAKLTAAQVVDIRRKRKSGVKGCDIAALYQIGQSTVSVIVNMKTWRGVR